MRLDEISYIPSKLTAQHSKPFTEGELKTACNKTVEV
jgi:hypothetical protein